MDGPCNSHFHIQPMKMMRQVVYFLAVVTVAFAKGDGRPYPSTKNTKNVFQKQEPHQFASVASFHSNVAPQQQQPAAVHQFQPAPSPYSFNYEAEGSARQESADASGKVTGSYTVTNEDGTVRVVKYVADENGFRADVDTNEAGTKTSNPANAEFKSTFIEPAAPAAPKKYSAGASSYKGQYEQKPIHFSLDGGNGGYSYNYESRLDDGGSSSQSESSDGAGKVTGRYSLSNADGRRRQVDYSSGSGGFQAKIDTNEFGTKSESPANVQFYSSAADHGPAPATATFSKTNFQQQQKQQVHFNTAPIQQQSIQATKFSTSPVKQQPIQDYAQFESKPSPYAFSYDAQLEDGSSSRTESSDASGKVVGSYSLSAADGRKRTIDYIADHQGFRATVNTNEFGTKSDSPADVQLYSNAPLEAPTHYKSSSSHQFSQKPIQAFSQEPIPVQQFNQKTKPVQQFNQKPYVQQFSQEPIPVQQFSKKLPQPVQKFSQEPVAAAFPTEQSQIKSTWSAAASTSNQFNDASKGAVQYNQGVDQYAPFDFNYVAQLEDGGSSSRTESGDGSGKVVGSYSLNAGDSRRTVDYLADHSGFRATVNTNEFGTKSDSPADVQFYSSAVQEPEQQQQFAAAATKPANAGGHYSAQASSAGHYSADSKTSFATQQRVEEQSFQPPSPYSFAYDAEAAGGSSARSESSDAAGKVTGSYTVRNEDGSMRVVEYVADENGFRANVKTNEPGTKSDDPADVVFKSDAPAYTAPVQQKPFQSKTNNFPQRTYSQKSSMVSQKAIDAWSR